jgi:hypothetical protein
MWQRTGKFIFAIKNQTIKRMLFTWNDDEVPFAVSSGRSIWRIQA